MQALIMTLIVVIVDIFSQGLKKMYIYFLIFLLLFCSAFFLNSRVHADELYFCNLNYDYLYKITDAANKDIIELTEWINKTKIDKRLTPDHYEMVEFYEEVLKKGNLL